MSQNRKLTVLFCLLGTFFLAGGMLIKDLAEYAPVVGWTGGFLFFLLSSFYASKVELERKKYLS